MKGLLLTLFMLGLVSCANKEKNLEEGDLASGEFLDDGTTIEENQESSDEELMVDDQGGEEYGPPEPEYSSNDSAGGASSGEMGTYVLKGNETLMQAAFKLYGDYRKWKHLMSINNLSAQDVSEGTVIKYEKPLNKFVWTPQGNPYLIKQGDTLGLISQKKYNTVKRWRDIFENNKPLIRDPNLIFAGFTLYYIPDGRNAASQ